MKTTRYARALTLVLLSTLGGASLSGCSRLGAMSRIDPAGIAVYPDGSRLRRSPTSEVQYNIAHNCPLVQGPGDFRSGAVNLDCFRFPEDWPDEMTPSDREQQIVARAGTMRPLLAYSRAASSTLDRNRLTALLMKHSDDVCTIEMGQITSNEATVNTSLSVLTTGFTAAANVVSGELAGAILTGGANLASGSRDHINAHVYRNQFAYAISRAITLERQRQREAIEARYSSNLADFTVDDAIRAANLYHSQCSFYKGLELVLASVENQDNLNRHLTAQARQQRSEQIRTEVARLDAALRGRETDPTAAELRQMRDSLRVESARLALTPDAPTATRGGAAEGGADETEPAVGGGN